MIGERTLRPAQAAILAYRGGPMAISAVPGAGKTFILEQLAAELIERGDARPSEILILTYMRSAALNFKRRIAKTLADRGRTVYGLQASTIHAFALAVGRRARGEGGEETRVWSKAETTRALMAGLDAWLAQPGNLVAWDAATADDPGEAYRAALRVAEKAIGEAKYRGVSPEELDALIGERHPHVAFLYRWVSAAREADGASDYDDMIADAVRLLETRADLRAWYQRRIRYVLEDEAQDSTPEQQRLLRLLTDPAMGGAGNLIRVGDANQAIMTSFTRNDPRWFRSFCAERDADGRHFPMPESSRSAVPIIRLANRLVDFVLDQHPDAEVRRAFTGQHIQPATAGKPNPEPTSAPSWTFYPGKNKADYGVREEIGVLSAVRAYLREHPEARAAILVRTHKQLDAYRQRAEAMEIALPSEARVHVGTAACLGLLRKVLGFLALPSERQAETLLEVLQHWAALRGVPFADWRALAAFARDLGAEGLIYPQAGLPPRKPPGLAAGDYAAVLQLGKALRGFLAMRHLPPIELLPSIAQVLLEDPHAVSTAAKAAAIATRWRDPALDPLEGLAAELARIADATGERGELIQPPGELAEPEPGRLTIMTLHASKGLEFDAVWLPGLGYYYGQKGHFPWDPEAVEIWDRAGFELDLALRPPEEGPLDPRAAEAAATRLAVAEGLRLLYVGLTRAEKELHLSAAGIDEAVVTPPHIAWLAAACDRRSP